MSIQFYQAPFSSATPVATALEELQVPHEAITFDLQKDDHKQPDYLQVNPNGTVPTLVVDGTPLFESLAILLWLGERYGVERGLWPSADSPDRLSALSWTTWTYATVGPVIVRHVLATSERAPTHLHSPAYAARAKLESDKWMGVLEKQLAKQPFLLGAEYTLVDLVVANTVQYATACGLPPTNFPSIAPWLAGCLKRPAMRAALGG